MSMKPIRTPGTPAAVGPYSQAYAAGDFLFVSGQAGLDPDTGAVVPGSVRAQAEQAIKNLQAILEAAGSDLAHVVKTTCFLANMKDFAKFNGIYESAFPSKPARTCVAVKSLPLGLLCEVEAVAYLGGKEGV